MWGTLMPGYDLGTADTGGSAFQDDQDSLGVNWELKAVKRFLHTRTSFESRIFYGLSWSNQTGGPAGIDIPNPISGANSNFTGGQAHLDSDLDHYGFDLSIRDTWRTAVGGLSAGMSFSYMAFDQEFQAEYNQVRILTETLDSDFLGGKGFVGWEGFVFGRATNLDLAFGYFNLDADYQFDGGSVTGNLGKSLADHASTVEASWTTWTHVGKYYTGLTLAGMYISEMPTIEHNVGSQVTLNTEDAGTVSAMVQILL